MKRPLRTIAMIAVAVLAFASGASAGGLRPLRFSAKQRPPDSAGAELSCVRLETLWIFDADFEDLAGDNAGWTTYDRSGTLASTNYWHHDTVRINGFAHLGDSTWWCGTYNTCWHQPRGYGNNWVQILERHFDEAAGASPSDPMVLEYDQRYAIEKDYDYGHVEIRSPAHPDSWYTLVSVTNPGFAGSFGISQDWDSTHPDGPGHMTVDLTGYAGDGFDLRFRFVSDDHYSSEDRYDDPPSSPFLDGAWQIDNIVVTVDGSPVFEDDCEHGPNGWETEDSPASGQAGMVFWRGQFGEGYDFVTGRDFTCDDRPAGSWMYAAVDPFSSTMVDDQHSWLMSPPIDIGGAEKLVGQWDHWIDLRSGAWDMYNLYLASSDVYGCAVDPASFVDEEPGWWVGGPFWSVWTDDWSAFTGRNWLGILWAQANFDTPSVPHMAGILVNRQRVGIPSGDAGTTFDWDIWHVFNDWADDQLPEALADSGRVRITDDDGILSVVLVATNGNITDYYDCERGTDDTTYWWVPPPSMEIIFGGEIHYWLEATDGAGNLATFPRGAPDDYWEMSILPITAQTSDPGILVVDKCGDEGLTPGARRDWRHPTNYYYREMLEILGYDFDTYNVEVPTGSTTQSNGPDSSCYKYYDTQVWVTGELNLRTLNPFDQANLRDWLNRAASGKERNLLISGSDWANELSEAGVETLGFLETWLAVDYLENSVGSVSVDSVPGLLEIGSGHTFMNHDDGECILRGGCPELVYFDVLDGSASLSGDEIVANYRLADLTTKPAGVAYTNVSVGSYQTVSLGFAMEFMMDGTVNGGSSNYTAEGYYHGGVEDRVNLLENIMEYFGKDPDDPGTGIGVERDVLSNAYPNPFNPSTTIEYRVRHSGPVTIAIHSVSGRVVRTLLDTDLEAGTSGRVAWDGTDESGERCASGVYFYRIEAAGFTSSRKMVLLK